MGLDFTNIKDRSGVALYILHNSNTVELARLESLAEEVQKLCDHQIAIIDIKTPNGEQIRDFYDVLPEQLPVVLCIRDDDTIAQMWSGHSIPAADVIAFTLKQESSE
jgi:pantothenate kinase